MTLDIIIIKRKANNKAAMTTPSQTTVKATSKEILKKELKEKLKLWNTYSYEKKKELYREYDFLDDWMLQRPHLEKLLSKIHWVPNMDAACDIKGSNKHFENFCSIDDDALKKDLTQYLVYCNIPFRLCEKFLEKFEKTKNQNKAFKALIVLPYRDSKKWFKDFLTRGRWRLVWYWPKGSYLFSEPSAIDRFNLNRRCATLSSREDILALELLDESDSKVCGYSLKESLIQHRL